MDEDVNEAVPEDADKDDEEEESNLQLSWEMLELAKFVFTRQLESSTDDQKVEVEKRICETLMLLGEVSLENENYQQAVDDMTVCLSRRQASLPADSRSIAEAEACLKSAITVLETRVTNLRKMESSDNLNKE